MRRWRRHLCRRFEALPRSPPKPCSTLTSALWTRAPQVEAVLQDAGVTLDASSNQALAASLAAVAAAAPASAPLVRALATRAMSEAQYFSTGAGGLLWWRVSWQGLQGGCGQRSWEALGVVVGCGVWRGLVVGRGRQTENHEHT